MSGETAAHESGWTVDTLKQLVDVQFTDLRRLMDERDSLLDERYATQTAAVNAAFAAAKDAVQTAMQSAKEAVDKAETAADRRFESVNEFRAQLADQAATFMPRTESISRHDRAAEQILSVMAKIDDEASRGSEARAAMEARFMAQIALMTSRLDLTQGRATGLGDGWGYLVGVVGVVGAVLAIVLGLR